MMRYQQILIYQSKKRCPVLNDRVMIKKVFVYSGVIAVTFFSLLGFADSYKKYHREKRYHQNRPYPIIDVTNGIPGWVNDYDNVVVSKPQNKGSYTSSQDNVTYDGKIYRKSYGTSNENVQIITVKPKSRGK